MNKHQAMIQNEPGTAVAELKRLYRAVKRADAPSREQIDALKGMIAAQVTLNPDDSVLHRNAIHYSLQLCGADETVAMLRQCMDTLDGHTDVLCAQIVQWAQDYVAHDNYDVARALMTIVPDTSAAAVYVTAMCMVNDGRLLDANAYFETAYQSGRHDRDTVELYEKYLGRTRQHDRQDDVFDNKVRDFPDDVALFDENAARLFGKGLFAAGLEASKRMLSLKPDSVSALSYCGAFHEKLGDKTSAEACYRKAMKIGPNDFRPVQALALLLADQGKHEAALMHVRDCAMLGIHTAQHMFLEARVLFHKGDLEGTANVCLNYLQQREDMGMLTLFLASAARDDVRLRRLRDFVDPKTFKKAADQAQLWKRNARNSRYVPDDIGHFAPDTFWAKAAVFGMRPVNRVTYDVVGRLSV